MRWVRQRDLWMAGLLFALAAGPLHARAQESHCVAEAGSLVLCGQVVDGAETPVSGATVALSYGDSRTSLSTTADASGRFHFVLQSGGKYAVAARAAGVRSEQVTGTIDSRALSPVKLVLLPEHDGTAARGDGAAGGVEFSDKPDFTVAGVTDWTAVGGHGSDATLRTSEGLARETLKLQDATSVPSVSSDPSKDGTEARLRAAVVMSPGSETATRALGEFYLRVERYREALPVLEQASALSHQQPEIEYDLALACRGIGDSAKAREHIARALRGKDSAASRRLAGEIDEALGDPLAAVEEYRRATELDGTEENYLAWGSELLVHRAVWQAGEVFAQGTKAHPNSARLKTAWGTALFSGALYEQASQQLCEASDLAPREVETYKLMAGIELASPTRLPCIEERVARFQGMRPERADADYLYAMTLLKSAGEVDRARVRSLLTSAVQLDPGLAEAQLELGKMAFAEHQYPLAIRLYRLAIVADPKLGEAHYRLAAAYDKVGEGERAKQEFKIHDEIAQSDAAQVEEERRQIKQFLVTQAPSPKDSKP